MIGWRLALYNFGMFRNGADDPANQPFFDSNAINLRAAETSDGFVARSGYDGEPGPPSWGLQVYPRCYVERGDGWSPSTLSLWDDLESPMAFSYAGIHAKAMRELDQTFVPEGWPFYVLWWVEPGLTPLWMEGAARLEHLYDHKATAQAFDFKTPFDARGLPARIDREAVRRKMAMNKARQERLLAEAT